MGGRKRILAKGFRYLYLGSVVFFFLLHYPWLWHYKRKGTNSYSKLVAMRRRMALLAARAVGLRFNIQSSGFDLPQSPFVVCANHSSNLDITAIMAAIPVAFSFLGKAELLGNPVTGFFFKTIDIPVDRENKRAAFNAFLNAKSRLQEGHSLAIFPEGGIDEVYPPQLSPFKAGAFKLAYDTGVPVLPLVIHDAWKLCWDDGAVLGMRPGRCRVSILPAMNPAHFRNAQELSDAVFLTMKEALESFGRNISP